MTHCQQQALYSICEAIKASHFDASKMPSKISVTNFKVSENSLHVWCTKTNDLHVSLRLTDKLFFDFLLFLLDLPVFAHHFLSDSASYKFSFYSTILLITSQPSVTWECVCDRSLKKINVQILHMLI